MKSSTRVRATALVVAVVGLIATSVMGLRDHRATAELRACNTEAEVQVLQVRQVSRTGVPLEVLVSLPSTVPAQRRFLIDVLDGDLHKGRVHVVYCTAHPELIRTYASFASDSDGRWFVVASASLSVLIGGLALAEIRHRRSNRSRPNQ